jgi:septal ring factor EnvC (AmiA/AmiB activator)
MNYIQHLNTFLAMMEEEQRSAKLSTDLSAAEERRQELEKSLTVLREEVRKLKQQMSQAARPTPAPGTAQQTPAGPPAPTPTQPTVLPPDPGTD